MVVGYTVKECPSLLSGLYQDKIVGYFDLTRKVTVDVSNREIIGNNNKVALFIRQFYKSNHVFG